MTIVIQCAASKRPAAGHLLSKRNKHINFVAHPEIAPADPTHEYARPDDLCETGLTWRQVLLNYNGDTQGNPLGLYPAYRLYDNKIYGRLVERFGVRKVYI